MTVITFSKIKQRNDMHLISRITGILLLIFLVGCPANTFATETIQQNAEMQESNNIYYCLSIGENHNRYALVNIKSSSLADLDEKTTKQLIPAGYTIINSYDCPPFSEYFILLKGNDVFLFNVKNQNINRIIELKSNEGIFVKHSITEKSKFFVVIEEYDPKTMMSDPISEGGGPKIIDVRSYLYDALSNIINRNTNVDNNFNNILAYDSINKRVFVYSGDHNSLYLKDLNGKATRKIMESDSLANFLYFNVDHNLLLVSEAGDSPKAKVHFPVLKGEVEVTPKNIARIAFIDLALSFPSKEVYIMDDNVKSMLNKDFPLSPPEIVTMDSKNRTIVMKKVELLSETEKQHGHIILLRYNQNNRIVECTYIPTEDVRQILFYNGKIYYISKFWYKPIGMMQVVNLATWRVEKSRPIRSNENVDFISVLSLDN